MENFRSGTTMAEKLIGVGGRMDLFTGRIPVGTGAGKFNSPDGMRKIIFFPISDGNQMERGAKRKSGKGVG